MTTNNKTRPPGSARPADPARDRVRRLLLEMDAELADTAKARKVEQAQRGASDRGRDLLRNKIREVRSGESDLERARRAASKTYNTRSSRSTKRAAVALLTASAVALPAFTGPQYSGFDKAVATQTVDAERYRQIASNLTASDKFKAALVEEEGVRYTVYRDVAGYPTVGVGHLVEPGDGLRVGDRISEEQALEFLEGDLAEAEAGVRDLVKDLPLYQHEFDALVDLVYNVGSGNVSPEQSPRLNMAIASGDYDGIAAELEYHYAGGQKANGLVYRSERRANIFQDAAYENPREAEQGDSIA